MMQARSPRAILETSCSRTARSAWSDTSVVQLWQLTQSGAWPVRSPAEIRALCEASGFRVEQLSAEAVVLPAGGGLSAPTVPGGAPYARLAARRL